MQKRQCNQAWTTKPSCSRQCVWSGEFKKYNTFSCNTSTDANNNFIYFKFINHRFDGEMFAANIELSAADRKKRGKLPRMIRYYHYCSWAHALMVHTFPLLVNAAISDNACVQTDSFLFVSFVRQKTEIAPEDSEFCFPQVVLDFIRQIVPGDIKGEIREARKYW